MRFSIPLGLVVVSTFVSSASAAVMGYWRFEEGAFLQDSSGNGLSLTQIDTAPVNTAIPATGAGSSFSPAIPSTGASNGHFAALDGGGNFSRSDSPALSVSTQLTAEFYFNVTTISGDAEMIVSQFRAIDGQRSWFVGVQSNQIRFGSSADGINNINQNSAFPTVSRVQTGIDYYGAVVYDAGTVTFYLKDLTNNGPLQTSVVTGFATSLNDTTSTLNIGSYSASNANFRFTGALDEIRLSNTALSQSELLISVPEPSMAGLMMIGTMALLRRKRR
jgi:hypothetical protein